MKRNSQSYPDLDNLPPQPPEVARAGEFIITDAFAATEKDQLEADREKEAHNAEVRALAKKPAKQRHVHVHLEDE